MQGQTVQSYKDLVVWQKSIDFVELVYRMTTSFPADERFGLSSQLRRASVSVASNIAEGCARSSTREFIRFISIALGSLAETDTQLIIGCKLGFVSQKDIAGANQSIEEIRRMLFKLKSSLSNRLSTYEMRDDDNLFLSDHPPLTTGH